jgi:hypothetical protein
MLISFFLFNPNFFILVKTVSAGEEAGTGAGLYPLSAREWSATPAT